MQVGMRIVVGIIFIGRYIYEIGLPDEYALIAIYGHYYLVCGELDIYISLIKKYSSKS